VTLFINSFGIGIRTAYQYIDHVVYPVKTYHIYSGTRIAIQQFCFWTFYKTYIIHFWFSSACIRVAPSGV